MKPIYEKPINKYQSNLLRDCKKRTPIHTETISEKVVATILFASVVLLTMFI
jgi:hypothetical protein